MGDVLIRNLDEDVIAAWKVRAQRNGRSLQAELSDLLREQIVSERKGAILERLRQIQAGTDMSRMTTEAWELIREDRDSR